MDVLAHGTAPGRRHSAWHLAGGAAVFLLAVQFVTGPLLALHYQPTVDTAYDSVRGIATEVSFGWLIRSVHHWSANFLVASLAVHLTSTFFLRAYRGRRELLWIAGCLALFCVLATSFCGYLLPWDERAFSATKVGTRIAGSPPLIGPIQLKLLRGGGDVTGATLTRFYCAHATVLPLALAGIVAAHLLLVQVRPGKTRRFFPDSMLLGGIVWAGLFAAIIGLAVLAPVGLGLRADPLKPAPPGTRPEWYFLFMFEALKRLPGRVLFIEGETLGIAAFALAALFVFLLPFFATTPARRKRLSWLGVLALAYVAAATAMALVSGGSAPQNEAVAEANRVTAERVVGLVWSWAVCAWLITALFMKWRHGRRLREIGFSARPRNE